MRGFKKNYKPTQQDLDNRAKQLNPNNRLYKGKKK